MKKILFIIDHFGTGGAQRQLVNLAIALKNKDYNIDIFIFYPKYDNFRNEVENIGINIIEYKKDKIGFSFKLLCNLRKLIRYNKYDICLSYLDTPSIYLILARIGLNTKIIVSDRSSFLKADNHYILAFKRQIFRLSDVVITNSITQAEWLVNFAKLSKKRVKTIYNGFDKSKYIYTNYIPYSKNTLRLLGIGSIRPVKNLQTLIYALEIVRKRNPGMMPQITWVGRTICEQYKNDILTILDKNREIKKRWYWKGEISDVSSIIAGHHALILPSLYEGLPNVVCEAMFSGKPVIASDVCDNPYLIENKIRGFLFDPESPESLAEAIINLGLLTKEEWKNMSIRNRRYAEEYLSLEIMSAKYENVFKMLF